MSEATTTATTTPITDALETAYWNGDVNVRDIFAGMTDLEAQLAAALEESKRMKKEMIYLGHKTQQYHMQNETRLAAEHAKVQKLEDGIKSILPKPPYHPDLEPEWVCLSGLVEGAGDIPEDLFAQVEARECFFSLYYEREKRSLLGDSGMIWRCGCGAPESYTVEGKTAKEAVGKALARAAELESSESHKRSRAK